MNNIEEKVITDTKIIDGTFVMLDQIEKMKNCFNCAEFEDNYGGLDNEVYVLCNMNPRPFDITTCKPICPKWRPSNG